MDSCLADQDRCPILAFSNKIKLGFIQSAAFAFSKAQIPVIVPLFGLAYGFCFTTFLLQYFKEN